MKLLTARDYTTHALEAKLLKAGYDEGQTEAVISRLVSERFLNDQRYAERFAEMALQQGRFVGYRLRQEMRRRGFSTEVINDVLALSDQQVTVQQRVIAKELLDKKYPGWSGGGEDAQRQRRRGLGFLQRRGFSAGIVMDLFRQDYSEE